MLWFGIVAVAWSLAALVIVPFLGRCVAWSSRSAGSPAERSASARVGTDAAPARLHSVTLVSDHRVQPFPVA